MTADRAKACLAQGHELVAGGPCVWCMTIDLGNRAHCLTCCRLLKGLRSARRKLTRLIRTVGAGL